MQNWLKTLTTEELIKLRDHSLAVYNAYLNMTGQGAWIMWDGDKQDAAQRQYQEASAEIRSREKAEANTNHLIH